MADSESRLGRENSKPTDRPDSGSTRGSDDIVAKAKQVSERGAAKERGSSHRANQRYSHVTLRPNVLPYGPDDFITDEMSQQGSIDFVALATLPAQLSDHRRCFRQSRDGSSTCAGGQQNGSHYAYPERGGYVSQHGIHDSTDWHVRGAPRANHGRAYSQGSTAETRPDFVIEDGEGGPVGGACGTEGVAQGAQPAVISRKKVRAKLKKRRRKALKAAARAQAAQAVQGTLDLSTVVTAHHVADYVFERIQPEHEERKRKRTESPGAADELEFKMVKTEPRPADENNNGAALTKDTTNKLKAAERAGTLACNPGANEQRSGTVQASEAVGDGEDQKVEPWSGGMVQASEAVKDGEDQNMEPLSEAALRTKQQREQTRNPDGTRRKQSRAGNPEITAQRLAFVCPVCNFHSFYKKNMAAHLESKFHRDHFGFLSEHLTGPVVDFLQTHFSNKYKRVEDFSKKLANPCAAICQLYEDRDLIRDISMEHFMRKAEAAHCLACDVYIPMQHPLIQQHLSSPDHDYNCKIMMVQSKHSGLSVAKQILSQRFIPKELKLYLKESALTDGPNVKPEEVWSTKEKAIPDEGADVRRQKVEPFRGRVMREEEAVWNGKDRKAEQFCGRMIQAAEAVGDGEDQKLEPLHGQQTQASEAVRDLVDQEVKTFHEQVIQALLAVGHRKDQRVEPLSGGMVQASEAVKDGEDENMELLSEGVVQASEAVRDLVDQEVKTFHEQVIQALEAVGHRKDQKVEPWSGGMVPATEAEKNVKKQHAAPTSEELFSAVEKMRNKEDQEQEEPKEHDQI